jgi:hypothetical protein
MLNKSDIELNVWGMNAIFLRKFFERNTIFQVFFHNCQFGFSCDEHKSTPINCNLSVQIMGVTSLFLAEPVGFDRQRRMLAACDLVRLCLTAVAWVHEGINWDEVPETLSLEQLHQLIHVSKRVAKSLVENEIPCIKSDKETHNYSINKRDLIEYLGTHSLKWHYIDHDPEPSLLITSIPNTVWYSCVIPL